MSEQVVVPPLGTPVDELWDVLLDLSERLDVPWSLVGGQMVLLHALEHRTRPPQLSQDGDVIVDIRAAPGSISRIVNELEALGFTLLGIDASGTAHRYLRGDPSQRRPVVIDVLAPESVGDRSDLTSSPPGHTLQVPGGTQALERTELVPVVVGERHGFVPRPTLLGAIVLKAAATGLAGDPARHLRDLALLCALLDDPFVTAGELRAKDRQRLELAAALDEANHPAWLLVPEQLRNDGRAAWRILNDRTLGRTEGRLGLAAALRERIASLDPPELEIPPRTDLPRGAPLEE